MLDVIYIGSAIAFFALMLAYVAACDRVGRSTEAERVVEDVS